MFFFFLLFLCWNLINHLEIMTLVFNSSEAEFKEIEQWLKFETRLKYGWFHLKLYSMFQDLSRRSIETGFWRIWDVAQIH